MLVVLSGIFACDTGGDIPVPEDETNWVIVISTEDWTVIEYSTNGQAQGTQNVVIDFASNGQYTLLIPEIMDFESSGIWTINEEGTRVTFNDGNQEIIAQSMIEANGSRMVLTFEWSNFKAQTVTYRIVLTN